MKKLLKKTACILIIALFIQATALGNTSSLSLAKVKSIQINYKKLTLYVGQTKKLKIKGTSKKVKWTSSKNKIASISKTGKVTAKKAGNTVITGKISSKKATCKVKVIKRNVSPTPLPDSATPVPEITQTPDSEITIPKDSATPAATQEPVVLETPAPSKTPVPAQTPVPTLTPISTKTPVPSKTPVPTFTPVSTKTPVPTQTPIPDKEIKIYTGGREITIGESVTQLKNDFGEPARIDETGYAYDYYIYNSDYSKFAMVAVTNGEVSGIYTDATDFSYETLNASSGISDVNSLFNKSYKLTKTLLFISDGYEYTICFDTLDTQKITGIQILKTSAYSITGNPVGEKELENLSREVWDLTNSIRVRNGLAPLEWSDIAAGTAKAHSIDMASKNYFDHTNLEGLSPFDRMTNAGIKFYAAAENIIAGLDTSIGAANGWFNSAGHRQNMLTSELKYLGVGFAYNANSSYRYYGTQNFYS